MLRWTLPNGLWWIQFKVSRWKEKIVKKEGLCWNCMSKSLLAKDCISKYIYQKENCGKNQHTLLHVDKKVYINTSSCNTLQIQNAVTYYQVLPVVVTNWPNQVKTNTLLDNRFWLKAYYVRACKTSKSKSISQTLEISKRYIHNQNNTS